MNQVYRKLSSETRLKETKYSNSMGLAKLDDFSKDMLTKIDETVLNYKNGNVSPAIDLSDFKTDGEDSSYSK